MSEAELHIIKARLQGGILNKARRGSLRFRSAFSTALLTSRSWTLLPNMHAGYISRSNTKRTNAACARTQRRGAMIGERACRARVRRYCKGWFSAACAAAR